MRTIALVLAAAIPAGGLAAQTPFDLAHYIARLRAPDATYADWQPILAAGKAAIPALEKLLKTEKNPCTRAAAAVLLYRLGQPKALDALDALLEANDPDARREAAQALAAFTGGPAACGQGLAAWRRWWKANRQKALATKPLSALYGKVMGVDEKTGLVATTLASRHGAYRGMTVNVRRGNTAVCLLRIVFTTPAGSVGRVTPLSNRTSAKPGDQCFWVKPQGK